MDKRALVEAELQRVRNETPHAVVRYTQGDCYQLHLLLKEKFPDATPWYDQIECHVLTELYGRLWDITGWMWSVGREPPHIVRWEETEERVRAEAPFWKWVPKETTVIA